MARGNFEDFVRKRPSAFWWILAHLVAISLAVVSWTTCLFLFNYPERPKNYDWLRKLSRLDPITAFTPMEAPEGAGADPSALYDKYARLNAEQLDALNLYLRRNYVTNYKSSRFTTYLEGSFRVLKSRPLRTGDFLHPGLAVTLQGYIEPEELDAPSPYPVFVDLILPLAEPLTDSPYQPGDLFVFSKITHRAAVLHVKKALSREEPAYHLTAVPLVYQNYLGKDGKPLPLAAPDPLNLRGPIPPTTLE